MSAVRHPEHDDLARTVRDWFRLPFEGMGYRAEAGRWGAYWDTGYVYPIAFPLGQVKEFLADLRQRYGERPATIAVDDPTLDASLGPALCAAGCVRGTADLFLAHVGDLPRPPPLEGLQIELACPANLVALATTRLQAFSDPERDPGADAVCAEVDRRQAEMGGTGRGMLARLHGQAAGMTWWYREPQDVWINFLGVRAAFRRRGIGERLLATCLARAYGEGCRSVVINVLAENEPAIRLYHRIGFVDQVYSRQRYLIP
jgi:ribosomal protein S18 acetylase RimI-like enzyme